MGGMTRMRSKSTVKAARGFSGRNAKTFSMALLEWGRGQKIALRALRRIVHVNKAKSIDYKVPIAEQNWE
jgi:ribosomal protein L20